MIFFRIFGRSKFFKSFFFLDRDAQHNISFSEISNAVGGAFVYTTAGEVSPILTMESNRFVNNCRQHYGNFTTCDAAVKIDVQNMQTFHFRVSFIYINLRGKTVHQNLFSSVQWETELN